MVRRRRNKLNNGTWDALASGSVTPENADAHVYAAHASCHHWMQVGTVANRARGELTVANVYAAAGLAEAALRHAGRCLELTKANRARMADWDLAFARDVLARAHAAAGDAIADPEDRRFFFEWFAGGNWHGLSAGLSATDRFA